MASHHPDLDQPHLPGLPPSKPLVIVLGLHRSGTTFLYQLLADVFPVAVTRLIHITEYRRLLHGWHTGALEAYGEALRERLAERGILDRGIDGFPISPDALEEYAFILRRHSPHWGYAPRSADLFDELTRKLSWIQPEGQALLLKNPFDLAAAPALHARYPQAKFVFIRRDPVRVLNSQFRNSFLYRKQPEPYLDLLLEGVPLWRFNFRLMSALNRVIPDALYQAVLVAGLRRSLERQLRAHYASLAALPAHCYTEVGYEALIADPSAVLAHLQTFLALPFRPGAAPTATQARLEPLLPSVEAAAAGFRRQLGAIPDAQRVATLPIPR